MSYVAREEYGEIQKLKEQPCLEVFCCFDLSSCHACRGFAVVLLPKHPLCCVTPLLLLQLIACGSIGAGNIRSSVPA